MKNKKLYLVGEKLDEHKNAWIFQGVYSDLDVATSKCINEDFFVARIELDYDESKKLQDFEWAYFPMLEEKPVE